MGKKQKEKKGKREKGSGREKEEKRGL